MLGHPNLSINQRIQRANRLTAANRTLRTTVRLKEAEIKALTVQNSNLQAELKIERQKNAGLTRNLTQALLRDAHLATHAEIDLQAELFGGPRRRGMRCVRVAKVDTGIRFYFRKVAA